MVTSMNPVENHIRALDLADATERRYAEGELVRMGQAAFEALSEAFPHVTLRQQVAILKLLGRMGQAQALPILRNALLDSQWLIRQAAVNGLSNFPAERVLPIIFHALYDPALLVRLEAITALGRLRHSSAVPTLLAHLHSTISEVEIYTLIEAIGQCADRSIVATLEPYMHHDNPQVRFRAVEAISRLTGTAR